MVNAYKIECPFSVFSRQWYPKKMVSDLWNSFRNKKALLEPKDVDQGLDWELILRSSIYLGREIVPEELIFDVGLGEDLRHQSNIGNDRLRRKEY